MLPHEHKDRVPTSDSQSGIYGDRGRWLARREDFECGWGKENYERRLGHRAEVYVEEAAVIENLGLSW